MSRRDSETLELALEELKAFAQVAQQLAWHSRAEPELERAQWPWLLSRLVERMDLAVRDYLAPESALDGRGVTSGDAQA